MAALFPRFGPHVVMGIDYFSFSVFRRRHDKNKMKKKNTLIRTQKSYLSDSNFSNQLRSRSQGADAAAAAADRKIK